MDALEAIFARRSIGRLTEPAPSDDDLATILRAAAAAPDHGELRPFHFTVLRGDGMDAFGKVLEDAYRARCEVAGVPIDPDKADKERTKLHRAPLVVIASCVCRGSDKVPFSEQVAAVVAAAQNALIAATALGYGSMWRTGEPAYDHRVKTALGLKPGDEIVGFLSLGTATPEARKQPRQPDLDGIVHEFG